MAVRSPKRVQESQHHPGPTVKTPNRLGIAARALIDPFHPPVHLSVDAARVLQVE